MKTVLVTGATSGIGLRVTEVLAMSGFYVYAGGRKSSDLLRLDSIRNVGSVRIDVTNSDSVITAYRHVLKQNRGLWGVVNNAGIYRPSKLCAGSLREVVRTFEVNVFGAIRVNKAFLPLLADSHGRTLAIGSIDGIRAGRLDGGYSASKFALEGYTDSLALEVKDLGITVGIVEPGAYKSSIRGKIASRLADACSADDFDMSDEEFTAIIQSEFQNDKLQEPTEVAAAALHFFSSARPRRRYLVAPDMFTSRRAVRTALKRAVELNGNQPYGYDTQELVSLLNGYLDDF